MKILLSAFSCEPHRGSEEGVGWHWAEGLARLGHDVHVLTHPRGRAAIERYMADHPQIASLRFHYIDIPHFEAAPGKYKFGSSTAESLLVCPVWQWLAYRYARKLHAAERFDLVHHITYGGVRQPSFMGKLGIPFILGPIGGGERAPYRLRTGYSWRGWAWDVSRDFQNFMIQFEPLMRHTFRSATTIFVKTPESALVIPARDRHKAQLGWEIGLAGAGSLQPSPERQRRPGDPLRILFVGRMLHFKGVDFALRALHDALGRNANVHLTIVGRGREKDRMVALAKALDLDRHVTWIDFLPQPELFAFYKTHDVFLFPSLHDSSGNVVLEAMGSGLPVVCLDLGGPGILVDAASGIVVETKGAGKDRVVSRLGQALKRLDDDAALRRELARGALDRANGFTWEAAIRHVYRSVPPLAEAPQPAAIGQEPAAVMRAGGSAAL